MSPYWLSLPQLIHHRIIMLYTKNPARLAANVSAKVANGAIIGGTNRKIAAKLAGRVADYEATCRNAKGDGAKGYKRPGSMQK